MPYTPAGVTVDPNGQTVVVNLTTPSGSAAVAYTTQHGGTLHSFPVTISSRTGFFVVDKEAYTLSATVGGAENANGAGGTRSVDLSGGGVLGVQVPVLDQAERVAQSGAFVARLSGTSATTAPLPFLNVSDFTGADTTGATDTTPAVQAAFDAGGNVKAVGTLLLDTPLVLDSTTFQRTHVIEGDGSTVIKLGTGGVTVTTFTSYDAGTKWLCLLNTNRTAISAGSVTPTDANRSTGGTFPTAPRLIVRNCIIDGQGANVGFIYGNTAAVKFENCVFRNLKYALSWRGYTDNNSLYNCQGTTAVSGGTYVVQNNNGDGLIIDGLKSFGQQVADITTAHGVQIRNPIGGGYKFVSCRGVDIQSPHLEMTDGSTITPAFYISNSTVVMDGLFTNVGHTAGQYCVQVVDSAGNQSHTDLTLRNPVFNQFYVSGDTDLTREVGLRLSAVNPSTRVRVINPTVVVTPNGQTSQWRESMQVSSAVAGITTALAAARGLLATSWELRQINGVWTVVNLNGAVSFEAAMAAPTLALDTAQTIPGTLTQGTSYEYAVAMRDSAGNYSAASSAVAGTAPAAKSITLDLTLPQTGTVVVWRKTGAGALSAPDAYIEIPADAYRTKWADTGVNINGRPWLTTSIPVPNTVAAANHTFDKLVLPDGTTHSRATDMPNVLTTGEAVFARRSITVNTITLTSGHVRLMGFTARKTETISKLYVKTGGTAAAATPTLCKMGVYSIDEAGALTLVASTANDTTLFAAATAGYEKALSASFQKVAGQRYALGVIVVTGAATPTFQGIGLSGGATDILMELPIEVANLTGQTDLPTTIAYASLTGNGSMIYGELRP